METSILPVSFSLHRAISPLHFASLRRSPVIKASSSPSPPPPSVSSQGAYRGVKPKRDWVGEWVSKNDGLARILPILVGGVSLVAVLLNRTISGIAPVSDASSSQSRADILTLSLAVTNLLTGLVWLSIRPKSISPVTPCGVECKWIKPGIESSAVHELLWAWDSLSKSTCCKSLVIVYGNDCHLQIGYMAESSQSNAVAVDVNKLTQGSLYKNCIQSSKQSYLANLSLYPGRTELPFLPANTQAVILQPIGNEGIAIIGGDTIRGFTNTDQAWISIVAEKLDATLTNFVQILV
ncbi:hypothetical protein LUZ60_002978 [Juncus effusus]|nr:hypothetical protein LUZ60_002978 [Juncus effusus]